MAIRQKGSVTAGFVPAPGDLQERELFLQLADRRAYSKDAVGNVVPLNTTFTHASAAPTAPQDGDRWLHADSGTEYTWLAAGSVWVELGQ